MRVGERWSDSIISNNAVRVAAEPRTLDGLVGLPNGGGK
jgi:hypothetical protein